MRTPLDVVVGAAGIGLERSGALLTDGLLSGPEARRLAIRLYAAADTYDQRVAATLEQLATPSALDVVHGLAPVGALDPRKRHEGTVRCQCGEQFEGRDRAHALQLLCVHLEGAAR